MEECDYCHRKSVIFVSNNLKIENGNYCGECFFKKNDNISININYKKENPIIIIDKNQHYIFILYKDKIEPELASIISSENNYVHDLCFDYCYSQSYQQIYFNNDNYLEHI